MKNYFKISKNKGISLLEILIVIAIIGILSAIIIPNLSRFQRQQALKNTTEDVVSLLNEARNNTISSKNSTTYGVYFLSDKAILFPGSSYTDSILNKQIDFDSSVWIPETGGINLNGGGDEIVFDRITGESANYGTITIQLISNPTTQKVISINQVGVVSVN
jgi:prepilin-type N-terminal cleavage/methylation domain-containing protein